MGFWDNFSRDYFNTGINKTVRNTVGNILGGYKTKGLLDWITKGDKKKKQEESQPNQLLRDVGGDRTSDTGQLPKEGDPKQDLDVQPVPVYGEPPKGAGFSSEEEALLEQLKETPQTTFDKSDETVETPTEDANYILQQVAGQNTIPLLKGKDKNKVPNVLLKEFAGDNRDEFNKELMKRVLETQLYNTRFGDVGEKFNDITKTALSGYYQNAPVEPKFDKDKMFRDVQGNQYQYKYNFYTGSYDAVPVSGEDGQIQTDLPKYDEKRIQVTMDEQGNAVLYDMQSGQTIPTGQKYTNFDPYYTLKERDISLDEAYKMGMLDIAQAKLLMSQSKQGNSGRGDGDGTSSNGVSFNTNTKQLEVDGVPLEAEDQVIGTGKYIVDPNTGQPVIDPNTRLPKMQTETVRGYNINGKFVSMADIDRIVGAVGKKGLTPYQRQQLNFYGIDIDKGGNFIDKGKTEIKKKESDWKGLWDIQYKRATNPKDPLHKQAVEWIQNKDNINYAKKIGIKVKE